MGSEPVLRSVEVVNVGCQQGLARQSAITQRHEQRGRCKRLDEAGQAHRSRERAQRLMIKQLDRGAMRCLSERGTKVEMVTYHTAQVVLCSYTRALGRLCISRCEEKPFVHGLRTLIPSQSARDGRPVRSRLVVKQTIRAHRSVPESFSGASRSQ